MEKLMRRKRGTLTRMVHAFRGAYYEFKDRLLNVDVYRKYGTRDWAQRHPRTEHDVEAPLINANVYIATRAISDALEGLPVDIVTEETTGSVTREIVDNDHEAYQIIQSPNPEHTFSDIVSHIVKSFLNDGNSLLSIEKSTGPNGRVELWPRDPRDVEISRDKKFYKFGKFTEYARTYPRDRVIHIRDVQVSDPFWGVGRVTTVREEIMMDHFINRFNSRFFENGATMNLMFTPDHDLSDDQHEQILDAMTGEVGGTERAFKLFINKYAGKFEWPEQRHKDIAFDKLLRMNREKIFGVYGLPPFRGGVLEYSNYANAVAQDLDFWLNTIKPIIMAIENGLNKQLIWPMFGTDVRIKFDLDSVPAIRGDDAERVEKLIKLKNAGIVSPEYVRQQLDISEDAAPDDIEPINPDGESPPVDKGDPKQEDKRKDAANALYALFKLQRTAVSASLRKMTASGSFMSALVDPDGQSKRAFQRHTFSTRVNGVILPALKEIADARGVLAMSNSSVVYNSCDHADEVNAFMRLAAIDIQTMAEQTERSLGDIISDIDQFHGSFRSMEKRVRGLFSAQRADEFVTKLMRDHTLRVQQWTRSIVRKSTENKTSKIFTD